MTESPILHRAEAHCFETEAEGHLACLEYRLEAGVMRITHTHVPEAIGGRGIAGRLVRAAVDQARASGWKVVPACSYAAAWITRQPEYSDLVAG